MGLPNMAANTAANQWFERTLDDSAIRRVILPEAFLAVDVILTLLANISDGLHVWPAVIHSHVMAELPFMSTEVILMECVKAGGDRQELHEAIRVHSMDAGAIVKGEGKPNDLLERIKKDVLFKSVWSKIDSLVDPAMFVGRAPEQVDEFLEEEVTPWLEKYGSLLKVANADDVNV
jgi:adenylosuccinate lyase